MTTVIQSQVEMNLEYAIQSVVKKQKAEMDERYGKVIDSGYAKITHYDIWKTTHCGVMDDVQGYRFLKEGVLIILQEGSIQIIRVEKDGWNGIVTLSGFALHHTKLIADTITSALDF